MSHYVVISKYNILKKTAFFIFKIRNSSSAVNNLCKGTRMYPNRKIGKITFNSI